MCHHEKKKQSNPLRFQAFYIFIVLSHHFQFIAKWLYNTYWRDEWIGKLHCRKLSFEHEKEQAKHNNHFLNGFRLWKKNYQCTLLEIIGFSLVRSTQSNKIFSFFYDRQWRCLKWELNQIKKNSRAHCHISISQRKSISFHVYLKRLVSACTQPLEYSIITRSHTLILFLFVFCRWEYLFGIFVLCNFVGIISVGMLVPRSHSALIHISDWITAHGQQKRKKRQCGWKTFAIQRDCLINECGSIVKMVMSRYQI